MNRRDFLKTGAALTVLGAAAKLAGPMRLEAAETAGEAAAGLPDMVAVRNGSPVAMFERAIAELGGMGRFVKPGQTVTVKPNIAWDQPTETAANTNPRLARHTTTYASNEKGLALAAAIQKHIGRELAPIRDCGAQTKSLAVCRNPAVPSCLIEVDFINLPEGEEASWDPQRHRRVAKAVALGLLDWMTE